MLFDTQCLAEVEQTASRFAARHIAPVASEADHGDPVFPAEIFARGCEAGFDRFALPETAGGHGFSLIEQAVLLTTLARTCAGHAAVFAVHSAILGALHEAGNAKILARLLATNNVAGAIVPIPTEARGFSAEVEVVGPPWRVTDEVGTAFNVSPNGVVVAFAGGERPVAFLAQAGKTGVRLGAPEFALGLRAMPLAESSFENAVLAEDDVIATGDQANKFYCALLRHIGLAVAAVAVGVLRGARLQALKYMADRYQGGAMIIDHSHLRSLVGAMTAAQTAAEGALLRAMTVGDLSTALGAKIAATEAAVRGATDAVQLLGGYGYMRDYGLEKRLRDAATLALLPIANPRAELLLAALAKEALA